MLHIVGVSMPRSGHHYLQRILTHSLGEKFGYCTCNDPYPQNSFTECCKSLPCTKAASRDFLLFLQKSHDFTSKIPLSKENRYLVQYRHPLPRMVSNFDLYARNNPERDTYDAFWEFADKEHKYYVNFWEKWIEPNHGNVVLIKYEDLVKNPVDTITCTLENFGI